MDELSRRKVRIRELILRPFRNLAAFQLNFAADNALVFGPNGRGKSNILEAISYLSIGKSVRGAKDPQAVPHGEEFFDIQAICTDERHDHQLRIFYGKKEGKKAFVDANPLPRVSDLLGVFRTVHFSPEDVSLVLRFPAQRRRLLDILISQSSGSYLRDLQRYNHVLTQRNHLLRAAKKSNRGHVDRQVMEPWDAQLVELGAGIRKYRLGALEKLNEPFTRYYDRFSPDKEEAVITYQGAKEGELEALRAELKEALERRRDQEAQMGHTLSGPHRDDLKFTLNGESAEIYASEGQLKTVLISWKLAEARYMEEQTGRQPVLLLDDVFSELDPGRTGKLLDIINEFEQVIATTPQKPDARQESSFEPIDLQK
ncbi:MAG TPA: DNA replication/repair protein RecF [Candidatus Handelsmanbacteria bacterium]|nr:DNA replication/repair protein RecF [Candidatus Handelsmanbacteria bacterium]